MTYGSICSGIEAATVAWHPLGWKPAFFAEIEKFPSAVLAHHYPEVPNLGDFTKIQPGDADPIDLLVAGTPCQSFSVAGKRLGLDDPRGNLTLEWLRLVQRVLPRWLVWENVSGVLSDDGGRTFGTILGTLAKLGYGFAYRVLDAGYMGAALPRRRVFIVGNSRNWKAAAAVLFDGQDDQVSHRRSVDGPRGHTLSAANTGSRNARGNLLCDGACLYAMTPRETERALGFADDYTLIPYRNGKPAADSPRYKAIGNSMAVPCMSWIGERIDFVDSLSEAT